MEQETDYLMECEEYLYEDSYIPKAGRDYFTDYDKQEFVEAILDLMPEINPQGYVTKKHFYRVVKKLQRQIDELKNKE